MDPSTPSPGHSITPPLNLAETVKNRAAHFGAEGHPLDQHSNRPVRAWRVLHACEPDPDVIGAIDAQATVGMRPSVVTLKGPVANANLACLSSENAESPRAVSLLTLWNDVRLWRKSLLSADPDSACDLVHAHSFAAGMAGVRTCPATVYDLSAFIEELAASSPLTSNSPGIPKARSTDSYGLNWLSRSFRVAEQFTVSRAAAIVVHSLAMRDALLQRGADKQDLFVVPAPLGLHWLEARPDAGWLWQVGLAKRSQVTLFAPDADLAGAPDSATLLQAFVLLRSEVENLRLLLVGDDRSPTISLKKINDPGISAAISFVSPSDRERALASADVILAGAGRHSLPNLTALAALAYGRALLAADVTANRDLSPDGRGCLWYRQHDAGDLAHRAAFLLRNPDFRRSLGEGGRNHLLATRSPAAVGTKYDAVYRHAHARRKSGNLQTPLVRLQPLQAPL